MYQRSEAHGSTWKEWLLSATPLLDRTPAGPSDYKVISPHPANKSVISLWTVFKTSHIKPISGLHQTMSTRREGIGSPDSNIYPRPLRPSGLRTRERTPQNRPHVDQPRLPSASAASFSLAPNSASPTTPTIVPLFESPVAADRARIGGEGGLVVHHQDV